MLSGLWPWKATAITKSKGNKRSRSPSGMTTRKAKVKIKLGSHRSFTRAANRIRILEKDTAFVARCRRDEVRETSGDFFIGNFEYQFAVGDVEGDRVAFADRGNRAAELCFGRDVSGHEATRGARETSVGEQCNRVGKLRDALDGCGNG